MVFEGRKRPDAASAVDLTDDAMRKALKKPETLAYLRQQQQVLLASAGARSISRLDNLADSAESEHAKFKSNELLLGLSGLVPVTRSENTHIHHGASPGLVIVYGETPPELLDGVTPHPGMRVDERRPLLIEAKAQHEGDE
jgi:hypothetical protein